MQPFIDSEMTLEVVGRRFVVTECVGRGQSKHLLNATKLGIVCRVCFFSSLFEPKLILCFLPGSFLMHFQHAHLHIPKTFGPCRFMMSVFYFLFWLSSCFDNIFRQ